MVGHTAYTSQNKTVLYIHELSLGVAPCDRYRQSQKKKQIDSNTFRGINMSTHSAIVISFIRWIQDARHSFHE